MTDLIRPPLPLHIDSTMMTCFRSCPRKFWLEFVLGLRPSLVSIDLHAGGCFALALETTYRGIWELGLALPAALERAHGAYCIAWGDFEIPEHKRTAKTFDRVWEAVMHYFAIWPPLTDHILPYRAADGKATFEYTFAIPLEPVGDSNGWTGKKCPACAGSGQVEKEGTFSCSACAGTGDENCTAFPEHPNGGPFLYSGRFDMLGSMNGRPVVRDEKTTGKSIGANWSEQWNLRSQFLGYVWACQQAGLDVDTVVVRGLAILITKFAEAEAIKTYDAQLISRWHEQLRRDLWRLRRAYDEGYFDYNLGDSCTAYGNCVFQTACAAPEDHQASWLSEFEVRHWNPLHKNPIQLPETSP